jgi:hypothetical protein
MTDYVGERAEWLSELVGTAQQDGELDPTLPRDALAHFCLLLSMGSALLPPELHSVDADDWSELLNRIVDAFSVPTSEKADSR